MPIMHLLAPKHDSPLDSALEQSAEDALAATVTCCGRRDVPRECVARDLADAQEKAHDSSWQVCPGCTAAFAAVAGGNP